MTLDTTITPGQGGHITDHDELHTQINALELAVAAAGNLPIATAAGALGDLAPGAAGQVLTADPTVAGKAKWAPSADALNVGPTFYNVMNHIGYDPIASDNSGAINGKIAEIPSGSSGVVVIPPNANANVANTINVGPGVHLQGAGWRGLVFGGLTYGGPNKLTWTGAANGTIVSVFDAQYASVRRLTLDGNSLAGMTALRIDSDNDPVTQNVTIEEVALMRCGTIVGGVYSGYGIRIGQTTSPADPEIDLVTIRDCVAMFCGTSISIESGNAMNAGIIDRFISGYCNTGLSITHCGQMTVRGLASFGGFYGTDPAHIHFRNNWNAVSFESCQTEGAEGLSLIVDGGAGLLSTPISLRSNVFGRPVELRSQCSVYSEGNSYGAGPAGFVISGTNINVVSHQDWDIINGVPMTFSNTGGASNTVGPARTISAGTVAWTPGAIAAGATVSTTLSIPCAAGDVVEGSYTQPIAVGLILSAYVYSANIVTWTITNTTGASVTPAAGTARARVMRELL